MMRRWAGPGLFGLVWIVLATLAPALAAETPRLAVLELVDRADLESAEADYLTDLVRGAAGAGGTVFVLTRENLGEALPPDIDLGACIGGCEVKIGRALGVDFIISGEVVDFGGELRVLLRLHAPRTGALLGSARAGAVRLAGIEAPLEAATERLLEAAGQAGQNRPPATASGPAPIADFARIVPRSTPRLSSGLFVQRAPVVMGRVEWRAADDALAEAVSAAVDDPSRAAALFRRGVLGWQWSAAVDQRAFAAADTCLARAVDAAARALCAAESDRRRREGQDGARVAVEALEALLTTGHPHGELDEALFALAASHLALGDRAAARATIEALTTRSPRSPRVPDARVLLGEMFFAEGRDPFAAQALEAVIERHRGAQVTLYARYLLGWALMRQGRHPAAIKQLRAVLSATADARVDHPADRADALLRREARADLVRAWAGREKPRLGRAFALFDEIDPAGRLRLPEALAELYTAQGRRQDAEAVLDRLRAALEPLCRAGDARRCGAMERLCASYGGAACARAE